MRIETIEFGESCVGELFGKAECGAVVISHGAGGTLKTPLLVQTAERLAEIGFLTLRWNFGYVARGSAPSAGGKRERPEMQLAIDYLKGQATAKPIILMGKSFGARVSTYVGAERSDIAGYVFYGLPLVGAGKSPKPRDWSHLAKLTGKAQFITGDRDRLCPLDALKEAQAFLQIPYESVVVPGDHSYKPRGEDQALKACLDWIGKEFQQLRFQSCF